MNIYGNIAIRVNGQTHRARGTVNLSPGAFEFAVASNTDGSVYRTQTASPPSASCSLERQSFVWDDAMMGAEFDLTIREIASGRTHIITRCRWVGKPVQDLQTGEVTGMSISWDPENYKVS